MVNYGEELAYWYLRLNGFFPISRFVIHRTRNNPYPSDCDVLAVRPPHVYEPIGGQPHDWDPWLLERIDIRECVGIICEVKTGKYAGGKLFRPDHVRYAVGRIGLVPQPAVDQLLDAWTQPVVRTAEGQCMAKLLIANDGGPSEHYLFRSLDQVRDFLQTRVRDYPREKYMDRHFFDSVLVQDVIDRFARSEDRRRQLPTQSSTKAKERAASVIQTAR